MYGPPLTKWPNCCKKYYITLQSESTSSKKVPNAGAVVVIDHLCFSLISCCFLAVFNTFCAVW